MVTAVTSSGSSLLSATSSSQTSSDLASLEAQLSEKKASLAETKDESEKAALEQAIATLEAKIAKAQVADKALASVKGDTAAKGEQAPEKLSGESDRIGTTNFDKDSEFGDRTAFV